MAGAIALVHSQVQEGGEAVSEIPKPIVYWMVSLVFILGLLLGGFMCEGEIERQAIRAGVAYYTNDASGTVQFKWKGAKP